MGITKPIEELRLEEVKTSISWGVSGITHTFSGQRGFHHRELGVTGSAMVLDELYTEVAKQTGLTIKPEAFKILYKLKPKNKFLLTTEQARCHGREDPLSSRCPL
nr:hypothetical protein [Mycoplasmatales bacterium]